MILRRIQLSVTSVDLPMTPHDCLTFVAPARASLAHAARRTGYRALGLGLSALAPRARRTAVGPRPVPRPVKLAGRSVLERGFYFVVSHDPRKPAHQHHVYDVNGPASGPPGAGRVEPSTAWSSLYTRRTATRSCAAPRTHTRGSPTCMLSARKGTRIGYEAITPRSPCSRADAGVALLRLVQAPEAGGRAGLTGRGRGEGVDGPANHHTATCDPRPARACEPMLYALACADEDGSS